MDQHTIPQDANQPQTMGTIPSDIEAFLESILEEADIMVIDEEEREEIFAKMYIQLDAFLIGKVLEHLPEDKVDAFLDLDEKGGDDPKIVQKYLEENLPNSKEVFAQAFEEFRNMYLENIAIEEARLEAMEEQDQNSSKVDMLEKLASGQQ